MPNDTPVSLGKPSDTVMTQSNNEPLKDKMAEELSLSLKTEEGKAVRLSPEKLDRVFALIERNLTPEKDKVQNALTDEIVASQLLSRFGIKDSKDLIRFLKTPAGETVQEMNREKLAELAAIEEDRQFEMREENAKRLRILAFVLLGLAFRAKEAQAKLNELIQNQIDEKLRTTAAKAKEDRQSLETPEHENLNSKLASYTAALDALDALFKEKTSELELLEQEKLRLIQQSEELETRYILLVGSVDELHAFSDEHFDEVHHSDAERLHALIDMINARIAALQQRLDPEALKVSESITENTDDKEIRVRLHNHHALHLQIGGFNDMLAVKTGEKKLYDAEGQETHSYRKAAFILIKDLQLVKHDGKFYLIGAHENFTDLSDEMKEKAQQRFDQLKPEISVTKNLVHHHYKMERDAHALHLQNNDTARASLRTHLTEISNQQMATRAIIASVRAEMQKAAPDVQKSEALLAATPTATPTTATATKLTAGQLQELHKAIDELAELYLMNEKANQTAINGLRNAYGQPGMVFPKAIGPLIAGQRIQPETMRFLERLKKNPQLLLTDKIDEANTLEREKKQGTEYEPPAVTPFSTTPNPYK